MVKEKEIKKTYYSLDIKNPYCGKGEFAWKHNDDSTLGKNEHGSYKLEDVDKLYVKERKTGKSHTQAIKHIRGKIDLD